MTSKTIILIASIAGLVVGLGSGYMLTVEPAAAMPGNICDIPRPKYCEPCGQPGTPPCPDGDSGWLCCSPSTGVCVEALGSCPAGHDFGWCDNFTTNEAGKATCHDGED